MSRKQVYDILSDDDKKHFLLGAILYDDNTKGGLNAISEQQASLYSDADLLGIIFFLSTDDSIDFESNTIAFQTINNCVNELNKRYPIAKEIDIDSKWEEFKKSILLDGKTDVQN